MIEPVAAFATWLGVSLIVLADGRRGLAAGLAIATAALSVLAWQTAGVIEGAAILAGGAVATAWRLRSGPRGWNIMPPGSTPRLVMCIAGGLLLLWVAASVMTGDGAGLRFAVLSGIALAGGRILATDDVSAMLTALAALALVIAVGAAEAGSAGPLPYAGAALVAAGSAFVRRKKADAR